MFPELLQLKSLIAQASPQLRSKVLSRVEFQGHSIPIHACELGSDSPDVPVLCFVAGVHGVERIGIQVLLSFLETLVQRLNWDQSLINGLSNLRLLFIPIVNPAGVLLQTRANGAGVDLMRNAPVEAEHKVPFLVGGQRMSSLLPWYRGKKRLPMQIESQTLCTVITQQLANSPFTLTLDIHSGYGFHDRLWFPRAGSYQPVAQLPEIFALHQLMETTYPHLAYVFEPQSRQYLTHGDLWDYLYLQHETQHSVVQRPFLPLTLEMGSWRWVKKNPRQLGSFFGLFNPVKPHRTRRVLRRHTTLLEFLIRAARAYDQWLPGELSREQFRESALKLWYDKG